MNDKIQSYQNLLFKWQKSINLISAKEENFFQRHIADSIQLTKFVTDHDFIIDIGSGAGLPGIPLAISSEKPVILIESDRKKAIFLNEAIRHLKIEAKVINDRIEVARLDSKPYKNIVITARALAELDLLLKLIQTFLENNNIARYKIILLKGAKVLQEIDKAEKTWDFSFTLEKSETDDAARILIIEKFKRI